MIAGLTSYITKGHLARAVLEATAFQTLEVVDAMNADSGIALKALKVDGGMTANNLLMQFLADLLDVPVVRPMVTETVSLGAAYAAGLAVGYWPDLEGLRSNWHRAGQWLPHMDADHPVPGVRQLAGRRPAHLRLDPRPLTVRRAPQPGDERSGGRHDVRCLQPDLVGRRRRRAGPARPLGSTRRGRRRSRARPAASVQPSTGAISRAAASAASTPRSQASIEIRVRRASTSSRCRAPSCDAA